MSTSFWKNKKMIQKISGDSGKVIRKISYMVPLCILLLSNIYLISRLSRKTVTDEKEVSASGWEGLLLEDYLCLLDDKADERSALLTQYIDAYGFENARLMAESSIQEGDDAKKLYLIRHSSEDNISRNVYTGILADYSGNAGAILFQIVGQYDFVSYEEFYDMRICDIDGNGDDDIILLLGEHRLQGWENFLPDIFCMIGLQSNGNYEYITNDDTEWLDEIISHLYDEQNVNRNIENIIDGFYTSFQSEREITSIMETDINSYIAVKDRLILEKINNRSLYAERELVWETFFTQDENNMQSIKIYQETGERGYGAAEQIAVYLFDYEMEEAQLQAMPELFADMTENGLKNIKIGKIDYKDANGDGKKELFVTADFVISPYGKEEEIRTYEITWFQGNKEGSRLKIFSDVSVIEK